MSKADDYKAAERFAPIDDDEILPVKVDTLEFIPEANRDQYRRTMDGGFRLYYVTNGDMLNYLANLDAIQAGKIKVFPEGETQASMAAAEEERKKASAEILRMADEMTAADQKKANEEAQARLDKKKARLQEVYSRRAAGYTSKGLKVIS